MLHWQQWQPPASAPDFCKYFYSLDIRQGSKYASGASFVYEIMLAIMLGDFSSRVDLNEKIMRIKNWNCDRAELEIYFGPQIPVTTRIRPYDLED